MRHFAILCLFVFTLGLSLAPLSNVQAQTIGDPPGGLCDCFCHSDEGAVRAPGVSGNYESCRSACDIIDERALGCYTAEMEANRPENNQLCWTAAECVADEVPTQIDGSGAILESAPSIWGGQESFCPENQGHCYNPRGAVSDYGGKTSVELGVEVNGLQEATDIAEYVEAVYTYLISAASILAVFMIMVAGLQYMMAGGNQAAIGKAKERMASALIGLTLILSAYVVARLIDPRLVDFNFFAVPKIQTIVFLSDDASCESLMESNITVTPDPPPSGVSAEECGATGTVDAGSATTVDVDSCNYVTCSDPAASCVRDTSSDTGYSCIRCGDIYDGSGTNIEANESTCGNALSSSAQEEADARSATGGDATGSKAACLYHNAGVGNLFANDACLELVYPDVPNQNFLDCDSLREFARENGSESCRMYDLVIGRAHDDGIVWETTAELDWLQENDNSFAMFSSLCVDDPCGVGYPSNGCAPYIHDTEVGLCSVKIPLTDVLIFGEGPACQAVAGLTFTANCYDQNYIDDWNEIVSIYDSISAAHPIEAVDKTWEMKAIWDELYPTDVNGDKNTDVYPSTW